MFKEFHCFAALYSTLGSKIILLLMQETVRKWLVSHSCLQGMSSLPYTLPKSSCLSKLPPLFSNATLGTKILSQEIWGKFNIQITSRIIQPSWEIILGAEDLPQAIIATILFTDSSYPHFHASQSRSVSFIMN